MYYCLREKDILTLYFSLFITFKLFLYNSSKGEEWSQRRKPAQEKLLRPAVVTSYVPLIEKVTNDLTKKIKAEPVVEDLLWTMTNYAIESKWNNISYTRTRQREQIFRQCEK